MLDKIRWRLFRLNGALLYRLRAWFTTAGLLALAGAAASALWGFDTTKAMAYQSFALFSALLLVALTAAALSRPAGLSIRRRLPRHGTVGQPLPYVLELENRGDAAQRGLSLRESLADPRPSLAEFRAERNPDDDSALWQDARPFWADRFIGFTRWRNLIARKTRALAEELAVPDIPPRGKIELKASVTPTRRGRLRLEGAALSRIEPLGLAKGRASLPAPQSVLILPERHPVPRLSLPGARRYQQGGVALSSSIGESEEFVGLRDYRSGDPLRRIHWRSWAKAGRPVVKEYEDEYFTRHALALDTFARPGQEALFEAAVSVAASFACSVMTEESLLDLLFVGDASYCFTAGRGLGGAERLLEALACAEICRGKPFSQLHASVASRRTSLSGVVCVLLSYDETRRAFVEHLRGVGLYVRAFVVSEKSATIPGVDVLERAKLAEGLARLRP